jgi:Cell wall-associated hydrolases (invasion-associated proteins)
MEITLACTLGYLRMRQPGLDLGARSRPWRPGTRSSQDATRCAPARRRRADRPVKRRAARALLVALAALMLGGCAFAPSKPPPVRDFATREQVFEDALGEIGRPYVYGGADADGFDCSGLIRYVYDEAGVDLPRTAAQQLHAGRRIPFRYAAPGDLVFYSFGGELHVTIYIGNGQVVHAPATGQTVKVQNVDTPYWRDHYLATVRILQ